jgi:hypothetical protein
MLELQPIRASASINKSCGGTVEMGGNAATLTGTVLFASAENPGHTQGVAINEDNG